MNLAKHDAETDLDMDMTPMIDVVFLLIIFFMIITDMTQQDLEDLELPTAIHAKPDEPPPDEWRPIMNVSHLGVIIVKKKTYYDPEVNLGPQKWDDLRLWLSAAAKRMKKAPFPEGSSNMIPDEPILIRADQSTPFKYVQYIMEQCGQQSISIWKLQLAVSPPPENQ